MANKEIELKATRRSAQEILGNGAKGLGGTSPHTLSISIRLVSFASSSGVPNFVCGWIIALVAWMVSASYFTIGQIAIVWLLTFLVGIGHFAHWIATSGEILATVVGGLLPVSIYSRWLLFATMGNIVGGVMIVSLLNYRQAKAGESES